MISNKIKLGQLIINVETKKIEKINLEIIEEILEIENKNIGDQKYFLLRINDNWLTKIFNFESKYMATNYMTVYTSLVHGLKIHNTNNKFFIGARISENNKGIGNFNGKLLYKPEIKTVNDLMDYLYLLKEQEFDFSPSDIKYINTVFKKYLSEV